MIMTMTVIMIMIMIVIMISHSNWTSFNNVFWEVLLKRKYLKRFSKLLKTVPKHCEKKPLTLETSSLKKSGRAWQIIGKYITVHPKRTVSFSEFRKKSHYSALNWGVNHVDIQLQVSNYEKLINTCNWTPTWSITWTNHDREFCYRYDYDSKIGQVRSSTPIWNYEHDHSLNCATRGSIKN